jgi:CRISPR-associated protein Cmr4
MRSKEAGTENIWYGRESGNGAGDNSTTEAFVKFEYASLLWLPVFCPGQPIVWVTCQKLLKRYQQITGHPILKDKDGKIIKDKDGKTKLAPLPVAGNAKLRRDRKFLFFNLGFLDNLISTPLLSDWVPPGVDVENLVVVDDSEIGIIHEMALYRQSRTKLENDVKKVENFFGVEALPEGSILVFPIATKVKDWHPFINGTSQELYFGGLESIGFGRCHVILESGEYNFMPWKPYALDEEARKLVKKAQEGDKGITEPSKQAFKESYKMREAIAFGLERFWGEAKRHETKEPAIAAYWKDTWNTLAEILKKTDVNLPEHDDVKTMADELWSLTREDQQIALAVLTQLCDSMVWWTQRYKG